MWSKASCLKRQHSTNVPVLAPGSRETTWLRTTKASHNTIWLPLTPVEMVGSAICGANLSAFNKAIGSFNSYPQDIDLSSR